MSYLLVSVHTVKLKAAYIATLVSLTASLRLFFSGSEFCLMSFIRIKPVHLFVISLYIDFFFFNLLVQMDLLLLCLLWRMSNVCHIVVMMRNGE